MQKRLAHTACYGKKGTTLIEGLVLLFIFSVAVVALYRTYFVGAQYVVDAQFKRGAIALAQERIEQVRNIPYESIALVDGVPAGEIIPDEIVEVNNMRFRILMSVRHVDDPFDGTAPQDTIPGDYKRVEVRVLWGAGTHPDVATAEAYSDTYSAQTMRIVSQFVPPSGIETGGSGGVLVINTVDAQALPLENAAVVISNTTTGVSITDTTNEYGQLIYPGIAAGEGYEIAVSHADYLSIATEPPLGTVDQAHTPTYGHATVIDHALQTMTFTLYKPSTLQLRVENALGELRNDVSLVVTGGFERGTQQGGDTTEPVYAFSQSLGEGHGAFTNIHPGLYTLTVPATAHIVSIDGVTAETEESFRIEEDEEKTVDVVVAQQGDVGVLRIAQDIETGEMIAGAEMIVTPVDPVDAEGNSLTLAPEYTAQSDRFGRVFVGYTDDDETLPEGSYTVEVRANGYVDYDETVELYGLDIGEISMTPE